MNRIIYTLTLLSVISVGMLVGVATATAQTAPRDRGFYTGMRFQGTHLSGISSEDGTFRVKEDGAGAQLYLGYSFNPVFSMELDLGGATHETSDPAIDVDMGSIQLLMHYRFRPGHGFRPFVKGGLAGYSLAFRNTPGNIRLEGGGVPVGVGFDYFFTRHFSIGLDASHNIIKYENAVADIGGASSVSVDIDAEGSMTALGMNVAFYF